MKTTKLISCGILMMLLFTVSIIKAQTNTLIISGGFWKTPENWSLAHVPVSVESVIVPDNYTVTINSAAACNRIDIGGDYIGTNASVTIFGSNSLDASGGVFIYEPFADGTNRLDVGEGTLNAGGIYLEGDGTSTHIVELAIGTGTANIISNSISGNGSEHSQVVLYGAGIINVDGHISGLTEFTGFAGSTVNVNEDIYNITTFNASSSTINIGGSMTGITSFNPGMGTVNYNGSSTQTVAGLTYNNLTINNSAGVTLGADATANNTLTVGSGKVLTINPAGKLTVSGTLTNNGTITIQSDASGTGSLITGSAGGTGSASAQRWMTTGAWHQVSPPVEGQTVSAFLTANANVATKDETSRAMMNYITSTNAWSSFYTNASAGTFATGQGYMMRTGTDAAVNFTGSITAGSTEVTLNGAGDTGWNLIGNPFTSAIDISSHDETDFLAANPSGSILDASNVGIYIWNQVGNKYDVINWAGADVAVLGQAFFVKSYIDGANVTFNSGMQLHNGAALKSAKSAYPEIKLIAANDGTNATTSIKFISGTSKGLDPGYDAGLFSLGATVSLYTRLVEDNGVNFMLQCLPANDFSSLIIPVGINSKAGGQVVFSAEAINLPDECKIILEDKLSKTFTDLSKIDYTTTIEANSSISDRFRLHTSYQTTGLDVSQSTEGQLSAYAIRNTEIRVKGEVSKQAIATLYDVQGRVVMIKNLEEGRLNIIRTPNIRSGIYMLFVKDNERMQGFKIPVTE